MTVTRAITDVFEGVASSGNIIAPTRDLGTGDGTPATISSWLNSGIYGGDTTTGTTSYSGFRMVTGGIDLSTRTLVGWQVATNNSNLTNIDTFANAGFRVIFDDGTNWAAYTMWGGNIGQFLANNEGALGNFGGLGSNDQSTSACYLLDRANRPTYASSGTLDWANISHIEVHVKPSSSARIQFVLGKFITADLSVFTGTVSGSSVFADFRSNHTNPGGGYDVYPWLFRPSSKFTLSAFQAAETVQIGLQIGDGSTTTTVSESGFSLSAWGTADDYDSSRAVPPNTSCLIDTARLIDIYQSAADSVTFTDFSWTSQSTIGWRVRGNTGGTATFTRGTFTQHDVAELSHGTYTDCSWQDCTVPIEITADTALTGGTIRDSYGMEITGASGDYSAITCNFASNSVSDLKLGEGGAGTYTLTGLTTSGTLYIWNSSTSNSVTATISSGVTNESIDLWFNYDNEASGPFTEGETLTFGNGATAKLQKLVDSGTTGTMYCELLTGSAPPDNNSITGGTSSATANVNEASGANSSTLTISQPVDTFTINSSESSSTIQIFTTGTQTLLDSATGSSLAFTHSGQTIDYTVQKAGFIPQRFTGVVLSGTTSVTVNLLASREYDASHGLTYTTDASWSRANNELTVPTFGPTVQAVFSLMIDSFISETSLRNTAFNIEMDGVNSLYLTNDAEGATDASIENMTRGGVGYIDSSGTETAEWFGVLSIGDNTTGATGEYQQIDGSTTADARTTGDFDEIIKMYGDASHGNFDYRGHAVFKYQINGYYQSRVDVLDLFGISTLSPTLYVLPMSPAATGVTTGDPSISITITDHTAAPITVGGKSFDYEIVDNGTNSAEDILREINYNLSLDATYQSKDPFNYPDMVIETGGNYESQYGRVEGQDTTTTFHGFYVSRSSADHPGFSRFQSNDGTYYTPATVAQISAPNLTTGRIQVVNETGRTSSAWAATTAYSLYDKVLRSTGTGSESGIGLYFQCTTAGTTGGTEPTWDTTVGNTTSDGTAVWTCRAIEFDNTTTTSGYSNSWTDHEEFDSGDTIRLRWVDEDDLEIGTSGIATAAGTTTFLDTPVSDSVYTTYSIDGSTVTEYTADFPNVEVDVNDPDNVFYLDRFYAWWKYNLTTADGIRNFFGGVAATNSSNILINDSVVDIFFDNTKAASARQGDSIVIQRDDGVYPQADPTSGGGGLGFYYSGIGYTAETGVSGLTAGESAKLDDITSVKAKTDQLTFTQANQVDSNVQYVNDVEVTGTGSEGDEWGP